MNKFTVTNRNDCKADDTKPSLYVISIGKKNYLHKSKTLWDGVDKFLDDVFRGMRGKSCPEFYSNVVDYCNEYPAINKVSVQIILNDAPDKILKKEAALLKSAKNDITSLNRTDLPQLKPEWMLKATFQKRCDNCISSGVVSGKKISFKFCPNCGRINK